MHESADKIQENTMNKADRHSAFRLLFDYIHRDRRLLFKAVGLLLLATAADVLGPLLAKIFIDDYLMQNNFAPAPLAGLLVAYLVSQLLAAWLRYHQTLRFTDMALAAVLDIRQRVFAHVLKVPMRYFDHAITGQLVSRITNDTEAIKDLYVQFLSVVLSNVILLIGIIIAMALLDLQLMLIALLLIPTIMAVIYIYQRLSGAAVALTRQLRSDINAQISESITGMDVIQAANQQQRFAARFDELNKRYYTARMRTVKIGAALLRPAIDLISVLVVIGILHLFGQQVVMGVAEIGVLYAFINYLGRFTEPLAEITQRFNLYQQAIVAGGRVHTLLQEPAQHYPDSPHQISRGELVLEALDFSYEAGKPALKNLSLTVPAGAFYAVVGHTGSGKSTLLRLILNFYQVQSGQIRIDSHPLADYSHEALRQGIGLIPQEPFIMSGSVHDNIDMGRNLSRKQIAEAARKAHLADVIEALPDGYDAILGERGTRLSAGQRQQLIIARALAAAPRILLLDEATANVDSETEQVVQRALNELRGEVTLIVVAHRLSTIRDADQILVLSQGERVELGSHPELMAIPGGRYQTMYRLQKQAEQVEQAAH